MRRLQFIAIAIAFSYALFAFLTWEINPAYWSGLGRFGFLLSLLISVAWAIILTVRMRAVQEFVEKQEERKAEVNRKSGGFQALLQKQLDAAEAARKTHSN